MRVYRVEFEGMNSEFHHAAAESQVIKWGFANALTLSSLDLDTSITLNTEGFTGGWSQYPYVTITAHEYESYRCNCCLKEVPGDGDYVICYLCGWENEISEEQYANIDGCNHMTLNEGRTNYAKHGHYKCKKSCNVYESVCVC